jgi:protein quaking
MMGDSTNNNTQSIADYLAQLLKDKKQMAAFPNVFLHMERLLDDGKNDSLLLNKLLNHGEFN